MSELKPCPFCGSNNVDLSGYLNGRYYDVACMACEAKGPVAQLADGAAEAWNRRQHDLPKV